jgi:Holliday junction DNA helicase RuvA
MIGRIKGILLAKHPPMLVVDVHGVGYELEAPLGVFAALPDLGRPVELFTHFAQREDQAVLYGFLREAERRMFRELLRVNGIGAKIALAILSAASAEQCARWIETADLAALTRIPGVGRKTAERIVVELRERASDWLAQAAAADASPASDPLSEASAALRQLGYKPQEAERLVRAVQAEGDSAEALLRKALRQALKG